MPYDGYWMDIENKYIYILNSLRVPMYCINNIIETFKIEKELIGTGNFTFNIIYRKEYDTIYRLLENGKGILHLRLEDYGEFIERDVSSIVENGQTILTVTCKDEHDKFNDHLFTLPNTYDNKNVTSYYAKPLVEYNEDGSISTDKENLMKRIFDDKYGGFVSWSSNKNLIDEEIDLGKIMTFKGIKNQNLYKFIHENMVTAYDIIPIFDSLNRTIQLKKTKNVCEDTGIIISFDNFIESFSKSNICDTFCTKMYTEGGNLTTNWVNPDGGSYLYNYDNCYPLMSNRLKEHLNNYKTTCETNEAEYKERFLLYNEAKTNSDVYETQVYALIDTDNKLYNEYSLYLELYGETDTRTVTARETYNDWLAETDYFNLVKKFHYWSALVTPRENSLKEINNMCKRDNFLTLEDKIELEQFETESNYKQEAFSYFEKATAQQKSDIALLLKEYATNELEKYNAPRNTISISLSNLCRIKECSNFARQLNVGKYITLRDEQDNLYKMIVVKIGYDRSNPQDLEITLSDKLSEHEFFPKLNDYLNNIIKTNQEVNELQEEFNDIKGDVTKVNYALDGVKSQVEQVQSVLKDNANKGFNTKNINVNNSDSSIILTFKDNGEGENAKVLTYTLSKTNKKITKIDGNGLDISVTYGVL